MLGRADPRGNRAGLVERYAHPSRQFHPVGFGVGIAQIEGAGDLPRHAYRRSKLALDLENPLPGGTLAVACPDHREAVGARPGHGVVLGCRQRRERLHLLQSFGGHAHDIREIRARIREGAARADQVGVGAGQPRPGERDVGACDLSDAEPVGGRFELSLEHPLVVRVELDHRPVADDIDIRDERGEQHVLLHRGEPRAVGKDFLLDAARLGVVAAAAIETLGYRQTGLIGVGRIGFPVPPGSSQGLVEAPLGDSGATLHDDPWPPVGERLADLLVTPPHAGAFGGQLRAVPVGLGQRLLDRQRSGRRDRRTADDDAERTRQRSPQCRWNHRTNRSAFSNPGRGSVLASKATRFEIPAPARIAHVARPGPGPSATIAATRPPSAS